MNHSAYHYQIDKYMSVNEQVLEPLNRLKLIKKINHSTNVITIRKYYEFEDSDKLLIKQSKFTIKVDQ